MIFLKRDYTVQFILNPKNQIPNPKNQIPRNTGISFSLCIRGRPPLEFGAWNLRILEFGAWNLRLGI